MVIKILNDFMKKRWREKDQKSAIFHHNSSTIIIKNIETWIRGLWISDENVVVKQYNLSDVYHTKFKW